MLVAFVYFMNGASSQNGASIHQSGQLPNMAKEFILNYVRMLFMGNRTTVLNSILADLSKYGVTLVISNVSSKYPGHDLSVYDNSQDIKLAAKHRFC